MKKRILHIISSVYWRGGEQQVEYMIHHSDAEFAYYLFCPENAALQKGIPAEAIYLPIKNDLDSMYSRLWN